VAIALNPEYNVEVWNMHGKLERIIRRSAGRRAPTDAEKAGVRSFIERYLDGDPRVTVERALAEIPQPDSLPAIAGVTVGPDGELLVQRGGWRESETESLFDIFDNTGRWMAEWRLPMRSRVVEMGRDYVLIVRRSENDVPLIEVYPVNRTG
jgi:hypothetical protein